MKRYDTLNERIETMDAKELANLVREGREIAKREKAERQKPQILYFARKALLARESAEGNADGQ